MSSLELPPVYDALLDEYTFASLLRDLAALPAVEVAVKRGAEDMADQNLSPTLLEARQLLEQGAVRAIQVRYAHEGRHWSDTILRTPAGIRLVRMAAPTP
jgi:hypothetical protein